MMEDQGDPRDLNRTPHSIETEQAVLGALLFDNGILDALPPNLNRSAFYEPFHQRLFDAASSTIRAGRPVDANLLLERFRQDEGFMALGGVAYLADLTDHAPPEAYVPEYANQLIDLAMRRDLVRAGHEIAARAGDPDVTALERLNEAEQSLQALAHQAPSHAAWKPAHAVAALAIQSARARAGRIELPFGLKDLDARTGGLRRGEVTVIAGRPAMGKSSAGLMVAKSLASIGKGVAFFSMEMPDTPLGLRMACDMAFSRGAPIYSGKSRNPTYFAAERNELDAEQWAELNAACRQMADWPLLFDVRPGLTPSIMESCARRAIRDWERQGIEPGALILDHLTIARSEKDRRGNKVAEVGDVSRALAEMAKRLDVPVVALCQLSRQVENRQNVDKRPTLSDLRWSGEIEQDARQVLMLYRPEYYVRPPEDPDDFEAEVQYRAELEKTRNRLTWIVAKNNNGPVCEVETFCDIACSAIRDREPA